MTREIALTQGFVALVDDDDYARVVAAGPWSLHVCGKNHYAGRSQRVSRGKHKPLRLHTFLTGWPLVDHVSGDGLDNRRANLRAATPSQNSANSATPSTNTTGLRGVGWYRRCSRWRAYIQVAGRQIHLGYFASSTAAAHAYDRAAVEHFGSFARLNFPKEISA